MKKSIKHPLCLSLCLVLALSLTACGPAPSDPTEMVANPFTQGTTTASEESASPNQASSSPMASAGEIISPPSSAVFGLRGSATELKPIEYDGGEATGYIYFGGDGWENLSAGFLLFVGGLPQPYRTEDEPEYAYLYTIHNVHPFEDPAYYEIHFIPVTGQEGESLDMQCVRLDWPGVYPSAIFPEANSKSPSCVSTGGNLFYATPPAQELPETTRRLVSQTVTTEKLVYAEQANLPTNGSLTVIYNMRFAESPDGFNTVFGITEDTQLHLHHEVYGSPQVQYRIVTFIDGQPVTTDPAEMPLIQFDQGEKVIVDQTISLQGFHENAELVTVLVPVNNMTNPDGSFQPSNNIDAIAHTFILTSAADKDELFGLTDNG